MHPRPDSAADLGPIGKLLAFIGVLTFRKGWNPCWPPKDKRIDAPRLYALNDEELSLMREFPLVASPNINQETTS
jgi:hypothetical protein